MFLSRIPSLPVYAQLQQPATSSTNTTIELPPEINQFDQLMKITKDNTPLAIIILIVLMFQRMQKKEREDKDHALVCDFERNEIEKKINTLESKIDAQAKDQAKIEVDQIQLLARVEMIEDKIKKINASIS